MLLNFLNLLLTIVLLCLFFLLAYPLLVPTCPRSRQSIIHELVCAIYFRFAFIVYKKNLYLAFLQSLLIIYNKVIPQ